MTRLIHFANYPNLHAGSFIPMLSAVMAAGIERGWRAEAFFTDFVDDNEWQADLAEGGVAVRFLPQASRRELSGRIAEVLAESDEPSVLHTHFTTYDIPAGLAARRRPDCPLFWHIHTVLAPGPLSWARNAAKFGPFRSRVDGVLVPAANIGDGLVRRLASADRVELMPSPIDPGEYLPPTEAQRISARAALGVPDGAAVLLHIGRAWQLKGGDHFLAAAKILLEQGQDVLALSLRGGDEGEREAAELGLGDHARMLGRVDDVRDLYAAADCFVAPSRGEGMPFSLVEALASGVPVVATDHLPGHRYLADAIDACVVVPGEPQALAEAVRALLQRPAPLREQQARAGRLWIEDNLSLRTAAERMAGLYEAALARRAGVGSGLA